MGEMNLADLRGNELPFLILFEIGEEGTPRQISSNIRHNFCAKELASATVQSFEHKKWNPLYDHCTGNNWSRWFNIERTEWNASFILVARISLTIFHEGGGGGGGWPFHDGILTAGKTVKIVHARPLAQDHKGTHHVTRQSFSKTFIHRRMK